MIPENQSKAGNDMKSLSSIDRSQHLLQNDYDVIIKGPGGTL